MSGISGAGNLILDGLVLHLDAANPKSYVSGSTTWGDLSGNRNNGTLVNGVGYSNSNNGTLTFDGTNDYISAINPTLFDITTSSFSVGCWVKLNTLPGSNPRLIAFMQDANNVFQLGTYGGGGVNVYDYFWFELKSNGVGYGSGWGTIKYIPNKWYYLVGTFDNELNISYTYIDGVRYTGYGIGGGNPNVANTLMICTNNTTSPTPINGNVSNVMIYNKALTQQEITQNYNVLKNRYI